MEVFYFLPFCHIDSRLLRFCHLDKLAGGGVNPLSNLLTLGFHLIIANSNTSVFQLNAFSPFSGELSQTEPYHLLPYPRPINSVSETHSVISQTQRPYVTTTIAECDVFGRGADVHLSELAGAVHRWIIEL